jgi:MFS family permease
MKKMKKLKLNNIIVLHGVTFFAALYFYHPIGTLYFQARGLNFVEINSLWAIIVGVMAIAEVPTGILADRIGRKLSIIIALFLQLIGEILFIFAHSYLLFAFISVIAGIGFAFSSGCFEAMMYDSLKKEGKEKEMQKVSGLNNSFSQLAVIMGALAGGAIAKDLELNSFIFIIKMTACSVGMAFFVSLLLHEPKSKYKHRDEKPLLLFKKGVILLKTDKSLQRIILLSLLTFPFIDYFMTFYQAYFLQAKIEGIWFGIALSLASLLGILASKYAYLLEMKMGVKRGVLVAVLLPGVFYFLMAAVYHPLFSILLFILAYGSMNLRKPIFSDYTNRHIESSNRATVLSIINMFSGIYVALMGIVLGVLADHKLNYAFLFMGCIIVVGALSLKLDVIHVEKNRGEE